MILPGGTDHIQAVFKDENGNAYDPDSQELKFYDSTGTLKDTKTEADCVKVIKGTWYIDYDVPLTAASGRWTCQWTATAGEDDFIFIFAFEVWGRTWPTIQEVRDYLAGMEDDRVTDAAIQLQIVVSVTEVDQDKSGTATEDLVARAYLAVAGYQTYLAYASEFERTMGMVPGPILNHLSLLKAKAEQFLGYVKRGAGKEAIGPIKSYTPTVVPETYERDAEGKPV